MIATYEKPQNARNTFRTNANPQYDAYRIKAYKMRLAQDITESSIKRINRLLANMSHMTSDSGPSWYRTIFFQREIKRQWLVYCVKQGLTGCYMPDNVAYFTRKIDALQYAASLARECRDDGYKVSGNAWDGYYYAWPDQYDDTAYCIEFGFIGFSTKAQRDKFIADNADF